MYEQQNSYQLKLRVLAQSHNISQKQSKIRGPNAILKDFDDKQNFVELLDENGLRNQHLIFSMTSQEQQTLMNNGLQQANSKTAFDLSGVENMDRFLVQQFNRQKYNDVLKSFRVARGDNLKKETQQKKMLLMQDRIVELGIDKRMKEDDDDEKPKTPVDMEFELGFNPIVKEKF